MQLLLGANDRLADYEDNLATAFLGRPADAIVLTGFTHSEALRRKLKRFAGPVVETFDLRPDPIDMAVGFDNFQASYDMTKYLIGKGYQRIVMASSLARTDDQQQDRARGFHVQAVGFSSAASSACSAPPWMRFVADQLDASEPGYHHGSVTQCSC
jgi:LacI family gluconate utilization system Gnt-I transcriptional repressor